MGYDGESSVVVSQSNDTTANPASLDIIEKKDSKYSYSYSGGE